MKGSPREDMFLGASHADKIGKIVVVDAEEVGKAVSCGVRGGLLGRVNNRTLLSGILHSTQDRYGAGGDVEGTSMTIGDVILIIDWSDAPDDMRITISTLTDN